MATSKKDPKKRALKIVKPLKAPKKKASKKGEAKETAGSKKKKTKKDKDRELAALDGKDKENVIPHTGEEDFAQLRELVLRQRGAIDNARWNLAAALYQVNDDSTFLHWGYPSWESYCENEVSMTARTAHYLIAMFSWFNTELVEHVSGFAPDDPRRVKAMERRDEIIEQIKEMGWTKGKCLVGILDLKNADEWIAKAKSMSATELEGAAKRALQIIRGEPEGKPVDVMKNVSFRLAEDQLAIVENAIQLASGTLESEKRGHVLSMICQDFVATNMAQGTAGQGKRTKYFDRVAAIFGVRFIAVDKETGKVVHGAALLKDLNKGAPEPEEAEETEKVEEPEGSEAPEDTEENDAI